MTYNLLSKFAVKQTGGTRGGWGSGITVFLLSLLILAIKVAVVQWSYNEVVPNLFAQKYRKITTTEALYLVILVQSLFN
jgi:hypothetical protein